MNHKFTFKYVENGLMCLVCLETGELINITETYNDFGRPRNLSPRRLLNTHFYKELLCDEIQKSHYEIEKVIKYRGKDVYVSAFIALTYLQNLRHKYDDYFNRWDSVSNTSDNDTVDYADLPF